MGAAGAAVNSGALIAGVLTILFVVQTLVVLGMFRFTREMIDNLYAMVEYQQRMLESLRNRLREQGRVTDDSIVKEEDFDVC